jgi:hypothetical protein
LLHPPTLEKYPTDVFGGERIVKIIYNLLPELLAPIGEVRTLSSTIECMSYRKGDINHFMMLLNALKEYLNGINGTEDFY